MKKTSILFFVLIIFTISAVSGDYSVMLQGFHWESSNFDWWNILRERSDDIKDMDIDYVWFPPLSKSAAKEGYLPNEYYDFNSAYGTRRELSDTVKEFNSKNIKVIADIVINHRVGTYDWADFTNPEWGPESVVCNDEWAHGSGNYDSGDGFHAARDIDHSNGQVRDDIVEWLKYMKSHIGVSAFRYDYVKGFDGKYIQYYNRYTQNEFSVGEYWVDLDVNNPDNNRQEIINWIDRTEGSSRAFDFTTKGLLQHAFKNNAYYKLKDNHGKPSGIIGWWPSRAVTFIDNHDTGPSKKMRDERSSGQSHWPFPEENILAGYAYIITHPGVPCVYWVHLFDWGKEYTENISNMIEIRKKFRINDESSVNIVEADNSKYAAIVDSRIAVKIGWGNWNPGNGWKQELSGHNFAIWSK
jgi:alpha-amylase